MTRHSVEQVSVYRLYLTLHTTSSPFLKFSIIIQIFELIIYLGPLFVLLFSIAD